MTEESRGRDDRDEAEAAGPERSEPSEPPEPSVVGVEDELDELRDELSALNDRHLRLAAEFDNYRKRNERDRRSLASRIQVDLLSSFLDVIDDLERVVETGGSSADSVVEGVRLVERKFLGVLKAAGLEPVEAEGQPFDPSLMEAMMTVPTDDPALDGRVADVFQKGYRLGDLLVRPARVRVYESGGAGAGS